VSRDVTDEQVINDATSRHLQQQLRDHRLQAGEARELALLLRSGSLSTGIYPIEERAVGPSVGEKNIEMGIRALIIGMVGVFLFMAVYYGPLPGLPMQSARQRSVARCAALNDGCFLVAARHRRIILTVGMAVDANVLIYGVFARKSARVSRSGGDSRGLREGLLSHCRFQR